MNLGLEKSQTSRRKDEVKTRQSFRAEIRLLMATEPVEHCDEAAMQRVKMSLLISWPSAEARRLFCGPDASDSELTTLLCQRLISHGVIFSPGFVRAVQLLLCR
jgi:hypothetical protein